jgi:hypothetical protein
MSETNFTLNGISVGAIKLDCTGLCPSAKHDFYVDGVLQTNNCALIVTSSTGTTGVGGLSGLFSGLSNIFSGVGDLFGINAWAAQLRTSVYGNLITTPAGTISFAYVLPQEGFSSWLNLADTQGSSGDVAATAGKSLFELRGPNSLAKMLVPQRPSLALPAG